MYYTAVDVYFLYTNDLYTEIALSVKVVVTND